DLGKVAFEDRWLHRVERGKHPCDRTRPGIRIAREQAGMALRDMKHDRPRLEQDELTVLIRRNLPEWVQRAMLGLLHRFERDKANVVRLTHFLERPANAHV